MMQAAKIAVFTTATLFSAAILAGAAAIQTRAHDPGWAAPGDAATRKNPLASKPDAAEGGGKIFKQRCAACHADSARGSKLAPDLTQPDVQSQTDGALFWKITTGNTRQGMPTFSYLPEAQRWQIVLWLRAQARQK